MFSLEFVYHSSFTFPSIFYHSLYDKRQRLTSNVNYDQLPEGSHDVIVFVHGRGGHPADFQILMNELRDSRYQFLAFYLGDTTHTLASQDAEVLDNYLKPLIPQINKIIFIGLSKGGLISIKCALSYRDKLKNIITASSPLNGTYLATNYPFCKNTRKELSYKSEFTQELRELSKDLPLCSIVPRFDHLIIPASSAYYPHSKTYFYSGYYSHSGILYAPEVISQIRSWI